MAGTPIAGWFQMEKPTQVDDLGVLSIFRKPPHVYTGNSYMIMLIMIFHAQQLCTSVPNLFPFVRIPAERETPCNTRRRHWVASTSVSQNAWGKRHRHLPPGNMMWSTGEPNRLTAIPLGWFTTGFTTE